MTLDDLKGRTYVDRADFWRDLERVIDDVRRETREATIREFEEAAKIVYPGQADPKCRTCNAVRRVLDVHSVDPRYGGHEFEPEEP